EESQSVSSYVLKMKGYIENLERLGQPIGQNLVVSLILVSLNKDFDRFMQNYNMHGTRKTVNELHAMLKLHEETLPKKYANLAVHAIRAGRGLRGSKKLEPGALSLYVGDGYRLAVEAIGTYHLEHHSGLVIVLNNCHYAPSITRGVILVLCLFDDGFINRFDDYNVISVSKNNLVYFMVIQQDGIFEIDMSYSNINDSSMYEITNKRAKINLDSSLLWHCRLGHISKKRIEKLLHDGLLNSINIESLGKCVSCMSGKMTRKSYSHQVERAKDLLGLIHTDVYLLKHKHEVFETFKVFQKEVENQVGKTIKSLHSNHRGEYMSQEFLDHLKEHGIIAHRTPPYTPQNNKVSERRNQTLLDMNAEFFKSKLLDLKASGSVEDLELIQEEDTNPSVDTSLNHKEDDQENDKPQSDTNPIRKSSRTRRATDRICLYIDAKEHKLGDLDGPANYKAALMDAESKKWLDAMNVEMQSVKDNDVKVLVELPPNARTVGRKWLFKKQTDMDGAIYIFKARLIAKGFTQTYGVNYEETYSSVADIRAIRIVIAIAACYDYEIWQMDVKISFLNGHLFKEVYMEQPEGFVNPEYPNHNSGEEHRNAVKSILKYHRNTKDMFLVYGEKLKQSIFATSSIDAEYIAAFDASNEAAWICKFIFGLSIVPTIEEPISMYCDNIGAIAIVKDDGVTKGARHFYVKVHYLRETIKLGDVKIKKIDTDDNLADPFIKALAFPKHSELTKNIGLLPTSSFM
nr:retrotransposon protein, putative, Ty1-copia subclass [Tanacetum cinerariifolium]